MRKSRAKQSPKRFLRCMACGRFANLDSFLKAARNQFKPQTGKPGGRGCKWEFKPMTAKERATMAKLLRAAADNLEALFK